MKKTACLAGLVVVLFSCNSGTKESSGTNSETKSEKVSTNDNTNSYECLLKFKDNYEGLLSKDDFTSVYPIDFSTAKKELRSGSYGEYIYRWPSDRPDINLEISGMKMKNPDQNTLGVNMLSFYSEDSKLKSNRDNFNMGYKELSQKELDQIDTNLDKENEDIKKTGKDLLKVRAKSSWEFVDNLGSSAWYKWNENYGGELAVLAGKAKFYVVIKISNDPDENRDLAKNLAQKILDKCK